MGTQAVDAVYALPAGKPGYASRVLNHRRPRWQQLDKMNGPTGSTILVLLDSAVISQDRRKHHLLIDLKEARMNNIRAYLSIAACAAAGTVLTFVLPGQCRRRVRQPAGGSRTEG